MGKPLSEISVTLKNFSGCEHSMLPIQPYNSTLIDIQLYQAVGRKRMYRALIGG